MFTKTIAYDRETRDYAMYLDDELVGFASTYHDAEVRLDEMVYAVLAHGGGHTIADPPGDNPLGDTEGDDEDPGEWIRHYTRAPSFDCQHGSAWRDQIGLLRWCTVGTDPNKAAA